MPKRTDIKSIMIIGAGPIVIGQACEFDYSGTQACKALRDEGYRVILVNSNPATIMTDPDFAEATYVEPITPEIVAKIIAKERPDAILPTMGGQTALNTAMALHEDGTLDKYNVELIGAKPDAINMAEDRSLFRDAMTRIGLATPQAGIAHTMEEALEALAVVGLPAIIRPSFTLGGTGGGIAYNRDEFQAIITTGLDASPTNEVLVEESVLGWKEYEMEVVRDHADNCIIVCSIENVDPMGIHTGDSVTVAPALTLTDKEYQILRNASIACLREIGVDTGGSNVQFALNPEDGRLVVIEMNPRVSRSSALASKATGFPIAKVAARLAVGYTLDELDNDITGGVIPASFEPTIDYVVTKIPRFTFEKFPSTDALLTTSMKSVGEAMSVGRTFAESLQKALRSMETGLSGLDEIIIPGIEEDPVDAVRAALARPAPDRLLVVAQALRHGMARDEIERITRIDPWFVDQVADLIAIEDDLKSNGLPRDVRRMRGIKAQGFSDQRLAQLTGQSTAQVMAHRHDLDVHPVYKRIDTCAAEFESHTPYMYSTYEGVNQPVECEARPSDREKIIILGGGPNRIGQGIEFDYCCVHAVFALREAGYEAIMVNCNPETVSTDYDTSDRLYFEPLTAEDVLEIVRLEQSNGSLKGLIVQFGGQTPLKLAAELEAAGVPILGTTPDAIDLAEDRYRFQQLLQQLNLKQPPNGIATSTEEAHEIAARIGFPVVVRPSYVLGGRAMEIVRDESQLDRYMREAVKVSGESPVLVDGYLADAIEVDLDALCDGTDVVVAGIMEHIEEAGIHSGDSACSLPPYSLNADIVDEIRRQADALARGLSVVGLMNVQFAVRGDEIFILEVNPRASRTVPFVAKAIGAPIAKLAARIMAGEKLADFDLNPDQHDHVAVKEAVFPFARFPGVDVLLGPEMKSTGEVMGLDTTFAAAFAKSQIAAGTELPRSGKVFISVKDKDKPAAAELARNLCELGFTIIATSGTATYLKGQNIVVQSVNKVLEGRPHIVDEITNGEIALIFNTTEGAQAIADSFTLRRAALTHGIPYYTTISGAKSAMQAIGHLMQQGLDVAPLQSYF
ncbi:MAG: carbamoyl-phosphate synthase large subunit [Rhodospirillaceae bacterium]|nr:carbamoyl-phosphate synthase large subunit [Rhodospirillaceae bacterium]MBT4691651.1 carbamoyl-phosphate synthase large subunit [Rhodospirillaceae bacterium]MBT5082196.1 carbamoyl-phosphate synthase large subunit [Rhodospirillaceae bacterium]MBT5526715.1 carbamoyl-phosphate synthase large subunit [Rhodospirillaceae bacterium]MBT5879080.1 carbamoyl-phosphate synthase large subunit [Rhodospirillaceae bacterium]